MRHGTSGKSKKGSATASSTSASSSCENSPFMKRVESSSRFKHNKEADGSFESNKSHPSTPTADVV